MKHLCRFGRNHHILYNKFYKKNLWKVTEFGVDEWNNEKKKNKGEKNEKLICRHS